MPPCWGCEPLLADPSLYAGLRRLSEDEKGSLTCQYLGLTTGCCLTLTPTGAAVPRGASAADLKKAFHRASLALHPDRVANAGGMDTVRRAEAVEVFKVISAAYDTERLSA